MYNSLFLIRGFTQSVSQGTGLERRKYNHDDQPHVVQHWRATPVGIQIEAGDHRFPCSRSQSIGSDGYRRLYLILGRGANLIRNL